MRKTTDYDVIVIGSGSGGEIVDAALSQGYTVAWVDKGPLGGTCLNVGCIPSKMIIYPADRIMEIKEAEKLGIKATITEINFKSIMKHMKESINESHEHMKQGLHQPIKGFQYYKGEAAFVDDYTIGINNELITGEKIFIGSGARPTIPPIDGINDVDYLTNNNVFDLQEKPESLIIVGGGYIAAEFAHFFSAMGTQVIILQRGNRLMSNAEPEISDLLKTTLEKRMTIITDFEVTAVEQQNQIRVSGKHTVNGDTKQFSAEKMMIAAGRTSNADRLNVEKTGVKLDEKGYIRVNDFLETTKKNIWAFGDAIGKYMFKHVANEEALISWQNASSDHQHKMNYQSVPYAVFTYPQIAGVGLTEKEATQQHNILVGKAQYADVAKGEAMMEVDGFSKAIVNKEDGTILGFHIIGPYAPILIQEVVNAMALGGQIGYIGQGMHIHPALPELILRTFGNLKEPTL